MGTYNPIKMKTKLNNPIKMKKLFLIASSAILFCSPNISLGQAPTLGTAAPFALFTAAGAFNNVGATTFVTGDVGTNVGAFNGFPPGTLVGTKHVTDAVSATAATDVDVAYNFLSGVTCGVVIGVTLGNNQVLTPNVYCIGAASTLNGDLILDGLGNPNALFIFKIDGALSTNAFSNVKLINSASICNVWWQINGAAGLTGLGDSSVFRGTMLVNGAISLGQGSSLYGRALSRAGAISLLNNKVSIGMQPTASIAASGNTSFCSGGSVVLTASVGNGVGPYTYLWSPGGQTTPSINASPTVTTIYSVTTNANNGCSAATATVLVTINSLPPIAAGNIAGTPTVCLGQSGVAYSIPALSGATGYIWTLSPGATIVSGANTNNITVAFNYTATNGNITVQGTNSCGTGAVSPGFAITTSYLPASAGSVTGLNAVCQGQTGVIYSVSAIAGATGYFWTLPAGATITSGANTNVITVSFAANASSGNIAVQGGNSCGIGTVSDYFSVTVCLSTVGILTLNTYSGGSVTIYPNPFSGSLNITINNISQMNKVELRMYNVLGEVVFTRSITNESTTFMINDLPSGIYFYKVLDSSKVIQSGRLVSQQ